jgi:hypothetical protein
MCFLSFGVDVRPQSADRSFECPVKINNKTTGIIDFYGKRLS